jgi:hypothetical protein
MQSLQTKPSNGLLCKRPGGSLQEDGSIAHAWCVQTVLVGE